MPDDFDPLALKNQLCFPLYAASRELTRLYRPHLDPLGLTYPQYVVMMALWERDGVAIGELGGRTHIDSGTLTPLLKRLEAKGYLRRERSELDERSVIVTLTDEGRALRERALSVPTSVGGCVRLEPGEATDLKHLLEKLLAVLAAQGA